MSDTRQEPCDVEILRLLRERKDDQLCQRAATLIEFAMWVLKDQVRSANQQQQN